MILKLYSSSISFESVISFACDDFIDNYFSKNPHHKYEME